MRIELCNLVEPNILIAQQYALQIFHFGEHNKNAKIYIQASLHADELPGALTAFFLKQKLLEYEAQGRLNSHIVLLPLANPIGLHQHLLYQPWGRFDLFSGRNFNRLYDLNLYQFVTNYLEKNNIVLGVDASKNIAIIRAAMEAGLAEFVPKTLVEVLQHRLLSLAHDADVVLDLHCDSDAILHMYTLPGLWQKIKPLAQYLHSQVQLVTDDTMVNPFDEVLSTPWLKLQKQFPTADIPLACAATTVELRGQLDLQYGFAQHDAKAIVYYLLQQGYIAGEVALPVNDIPEPTPLSFVQTVLAPGNGIVVFGVKPGDWVSKGQKLLDIVNPLDGLITTMYADTDGLVYARNYMAHFAVMGMELMNIAGNRDLHQGIHLSP